MNCRTGDSLGNEEAEADSREQVLGALGKAATRLRAKLGESMASVQKYDTPIEQASTPSLDALKAFSLGEKEIRESSQSPSATTAGVAHLEQAIQLDPSFALAYRNLGTAYFNLYGPSRGCDVFRQGI